MNDYSQLALARQYQNSRRMDSEFVSSHILLYSLVIFQIRMRVFSKNCYGVVQPAQNAAQGAAKAPSGCHHWHVLPALGLLRRRFDRVRRVYYDKAI